MSVTNPVAPPIDKFADTRLPQFWFEWHKTTRKVYRCNIPGSWKDATFVPSLTAMRAEVSCIAEHAEHHAQAYAFVQTYVRGYLYYLAESENLSQVENLEKESCLKKISQPKRTIPSQT